ncbi:MAG: hypothetical protein QOI39_2020, partial [Mycobacterium sp.]|nr:hypothetical protein [Mycobacterium sp.]
FVIGSDAKLFHNSVMRVVGPERQNPLGSV